MVMPACWKIQESHDHIKWNYKTLDLELVMATSISTASPWFSGWLGPEKVPGNQKKIPVLDYRDCGIARNY